MRGLVVNLALNNEQSGGIALCPVKTEQSVAPTRICICGNFTNAIEALVQSSFFTAAI